jgi:hypothetical protein
MVRTPNDYFEVTPFMEEMRMLHMQEEKKNDNEETVDMDEQSKSPEELEKSDIDEEADDEPASEITEED